VKYRIPDDIDDIMCGVAVMKGDTLAYVFGQNSEQAGVGLTRGEGVLDFRVAHLPLLQGHYVITVALHDMVAQKIYDCHERRHWFSVFDDPSLPSVGGMVHVAIQWTVTLSDTSSPATPVSTS